MSKVFRMTITHFLLTLERVLLETKSISSLWELTGLQSSTFTILFIGIIRY